MRYYYLFLDESGSFKDRRKNYAPSIVAGYLIQSTEMQDFSQQKAWAKHLLQDLSESDARYQGILNENGHFHCMECKNPYLPDFIIALFQQMAAKDIRLVQFKNQPQQTIIDSDTTYLNIFTEGVLSLIKYLIKNTDEKFSLRIAYAHRRSDRIFEETNKYASIAQEDYETRIKERLTLMLSRLSAAEKGQLAAQHLKLWTGNAIDEPRLQLADAACFALRGGHEKFSQEQCDYIEGITLSFNVPEKEGWDIITDCFDQGRTDEAIFLWYGGLLERMENLYRNQFHRRLLTMLQNADPWEQHLLTGLLSQRFQQLIRQMDYSLVDRIVAYMDRDFFPLLAKNGIHLPALAFDIHFERFTTATHEGDITTAEGERESLETIVHQLPPTYETLDTYLSYRLRVVEHQKNMYDFAGALTALDRLKAALAKMLSALQSIDELGDYAKRMTSGTLGKIYGSRASTRAYLGLSDAKLFDAAREDTARALEQFDTFTADSQRIAQTRCMIEYFAGDFDAAFSWLSLSLRDKSDNAAPEDLLSKIFSQKRGTNLFGLMHYTALLHAAARRESPLAPALYDAIKPYLDGDTWEKLTGYPMCNILWHLYAAAQLLGDSEHEDWYTRALTIATANPQCIPLIVTSLAMRLEHIALSGQATDDEFFTLCEIHQQLLADESLPATLKSVLGNLYGPLSLMSGIADAPKYRRRILTLISHFPIL